jgi:hypoxanthine phosphoribosyltransferase
VTGGSLEATGTPRSTEITDGPTAAPDEREALAAAPAEGTRFAHASEGEMARILDFYAVRWEYEPTTFPILWNLDGEVVESFAPDFYLPDLEVFLEMTTLKQRLVRKKNRKLRRLRELYPDIRIKLFYARDFRAMMLKYGRLGLARSLSGTLGQVASERATIVPTIAAVEIEEIARTEATVSVDGAAADAVAAPDAGSIVDTSPANADRTLAPSGPRATPRTRPSRRRRRPRRPTESGAEREAGT